MCYYYPTCSHIGTSIPLVYQHQHQLNANPPAQIEGVYFASDALSQSSVFTHETTRTYATNSTTSPNANLYFLAQVTQIISGSPKITTAYYIILIRTLPEKK